jgi:subtilisin
MIHRNKVFTITALVLLVVMLSGLMVSPALGQQPERVKVLIGFTRQPGPAEEELVRGVGGTIKYTYHLVPAIAATLPEGAIDGLRRNPNVTSIDLDGQVWAIDTELDNAWGVKRIGAGTVHGYNKGTGVKVAIIDSGIAYTHPDLDANYKGGYDFVNSDYDPMDDYGHGTHVAGTVAAVANGFGVVGVAPEAHLYALKVLNASGSGYWSDIIAAVQWCVDNGMQVANLSLGSDRDPGGTVKAAFDTAEAAGVVIVAAAGNSGNAAGKGNNVIYPARYDSVIAVAATDSSDNRASWSSTGDQVELAAPGVAVFSIWNDSDSPYDPQPVCDESEGCYKYGSGTSMASPHVAGTAALVIASGIGDANGNVRINDEVRLRLQQTADDLGAAGRDPQYGFGLVDADEAAPAPATTGSIAGTVTNASDGSGIEGATVILDTSQSATTDTNGAYAIADVPTGDHTVTASADGFNSASQTVTVSENATTTANFALTPKTTAPTVNVDSITYATEGGRYNDKHLNITVALVDDLGNPVAGASVLIRLDNTTTDQSWTGTGTTGTDGTATVGLKSAPSGCYTTTVTEVTAEGLTWDGVTPENGFCK